MTLAEAFKLYLAKSDQHGLPWQASEADLLLTFTAGWDAKAESLKQQDLFPGTLSEPVLPDSICAITAEDIWLAWPVGFKTARGAAIPAIKKAIKKVGGAYLLAAVKEYALAVNDWPIADQQYVPMCSTWMNQERWADERSKWQRGAPVRPSQFGKKYT